RRDEVGGQLLDETHGVGEQDFAAGRQLQLAGGRIESGEQLLLCAHACARQNVEQRRLAGVRVADDRRRVQLGPPSSGALLVSLRSEERRVGQGGCSRWVEGAVLEKRW